MTKDGDQRTLSQPLADAAQAHLPNPNLLAAAQEVEKLKLTCPNGKIAAEDVMAAVGDSARYSVFDLVDQCLSQNSKKAMHILETLKAEGVQPSITLWALSRQVRLISQLKASTGNTESILRKYTVPKNKTAQVSRLASALPNHFTDLTLRLCFMADQSIKGNRKEDPWTLLSDIVMAFCNTNFISFDYISLR